MVVRYALPSLFVLTVSCAMAQGDQCMEAWLIDPGPQVADGPFTGEGASQDDALNADWYVYDPPAAGFITVSSCGGPRDTRVHIHTGSCDDLQLLGSDDDGCPDGYPPGNSLLANTPVTPGNLYFIEWDDRWSMQGFDWELLFHTCPIAVPSFTSSDTALDVTWDGILPGALYTLEYGPEGFTPGTGEVITGVEGGEPPVVHIGGLVQASTYDVYIRVDCGEEGEAPFTGPWHPETTGTLVNDDCGGALTITCGSTANGSTATAVDDQVEDCGTGIQAPGIWYTFTGVSGNVVLTTCGLNGYDTRLNVYSGPCDALVCEAGNDDGQFCDLGSEITMAADASLTYRVLVQGYDGETGDFGLAMECPACAAPTDITVNAGDVQALVGWTSHNTGATFTVEYGPGGFTPGTGQTVGGTVGADGPPVLLQGLAAAAVYEVYVTEDCGAGGPSTQRGPVGFETVAGPLPPNAFCGGAIAIDCGQDVTGDTQDGFIAQNADCTDYPVSAKGLWYTFTGQGVEATLSTCDQTAFDTRINVLTGTCAAPVCVISNDDGMGCGGNSSRLSFVAQEGVQYLVLVHGYNDAAGSFTLSMGCAEPCEPAVPNDACAGAIALPTSPVGDCTVVEGTNACAYDGPDATPPCDAYAEIRDVWFSFNTGLSPSHTLTVTPGTAADLHMALYANCGDFTPVTCLESVDQPLNLLGLQASTDYYLRVWNHGGADAGTFTVCHEVAPSVGVDEVGAANAAQAWPSPVHDLLHYSGLPVDVRELQLIDAQGRVARAVRADGRTSGVVDVGGLSPGVYVLRAAARTAWQVRVVVDR